MDQRCGDRVDDLIEPGDSLSEVAWIRFEVTWSRTRSCHTGLVRELLVLCLGCPMSVRESLDARLRSRGVGHVVDAAEDRDATVVLVYCSSDANFDAVAESARAATTVAMVVQLDPDHYARALANGASGVVHYDTSAEIIESVLAGAICGEVIVPAAIAQAFGAAWTLTAAPTDLTAYEIGLLVSLVNGDRVSDMATKYTYSERMVRRHLQNLYVKLGVNGRTAAIVHAGKLRLV